VQGRLLDKDILELRKDNKDILELQHKDKDIPEPLSDLERHLRDIQDQEALHQDRVMEVQHHQVRVTEEQHHLVSSRGMVVEHNSSKVMEEDISSRVMVEQLHLVLDILVEHHRWMGRCSSGSMLLIKTEADKLTLRSFKKLWSMATGATSARKPVE